MDRLDEHLMATALIQASSLPIVMLLLWARLGHAVVTDERHWSKSRETFTDSNRCSLARI